VNERVLVELGPEGAKLQQLLKELCNAVGIDRKSLDSQELKLVPSSRLSNSEDRVIGKHSPSIDQNYHDFWYEVKSDQKCSLIDEQKSMAAVEHGKTKMVSPKKVEPLG
jgi:hypothetical protein